jgi:hypothetical protein
MSELLSRRLRLKRGLLCSGGKNIFMLDCKLIILSMKWWNALLDAAAQGSYTFRRGAYGSVSIKIRVDRSMNPKREG